jgi:hypothetical protein
MPTKEFEIALSTFEKLRAAFPALSMEFDLEPAHVDLAVDIPVQAGLSFPVFLNLQNGDELCIGASALGVSWFPCTNPPKVENYFEAVSGLLSGRFRILQHWRGKRVVKAELQQPTSDGWKIITGCSYLLSVPWPPKTFQVVQNTPAVESERNWQGQSPG